MPSEELAYSEMTLDQIEGHLRALRSRREERPEPKVRQARTVTAKDPTKVGAKPVVDMSTLFGDVLSEEGA